MSRVRIIQNNVWEMKNGMDICMFVNSHLLDDGHYSETVHFVDTKYPFLHKLLSFNREHGKEALVFKIRIDAVNVCFFFMRTLSAEPSCRRLVEMKKGLRMLRNALPGYRRFAVQRGPLAYELRSEFRSVFNRSDGELWLCGEPDGVQLYHSIDRPVETVAVCQISPSVEKLEENIWQLVTGYGIVMFIDMQVMLTDDWRDRVVDLVDAKYPFKDLLLEKINIKPMAAGEVLMLPADRSVIICIFVNYDDPEDRFCMRLKKAFFTIKNLTAGNVRLAVQVDTSLPEFIRTMTEDLIVYTFKSIYKRTSREDILKATLFLCGRQPTKGNH